MFLYTYIQACVFLHTYRHSVFLYRYRHVCSYIHTGTADTQAQRVLRPYTRPRQALERHPRWPLLRQLGHVTLTSGWADSVARGPEGYLRDLYETS